MKCCCSRCGCTFEDEDVAISDKAARKSGAIFRISFCYECGSKLFSGKNFLALDELKGQIHTQEEAKDY